MELYLYGLFDDRYGAPGRYSIYHCGKCGFGETHPRLKESEIGKFYAKYYPLSKTTSATIRDSAKIPNRFYSWLCGTDNAAHYYISPKSKVLDIGSGSGRSLLEIEKLEGEAYGVEPDPNAQKIAEKLGLNVYQGLITDNVFPGEMFDYITASQVIEHDPDPETFMKAVYKRLKDRGRAIFSFPNTESLSQKIFKEKWIHWHVPYHCNFFTKKSFILLADSVGFKIKKMITVTPNDWTVIQLLMLPQNTKEGKMGSAWSMINESKVKPRSIIFKVLKNIIIFIALMPITITNRLIDIFGWGESLLVIMEKENEK